MDEGKRQLLVGSFADKSFEDELKEGEKNIRELFEKHIEANKDKIKEIAKNDHVFFSVESRAKTLESFKEKIQRKNYLVTWVCDDTKEEVQAFIRGNLPDLIGVRINCYFWNQEKVLYDFFYKDHEFSKKYSLNFDEAIIQKNGKPIYKFTGKFDRPFDNKPLNFEVQIKCVMNNIWSEVEHQIVYKNRNYNSFIQQNKSITDTIYSVLDASDKQLYSLFNTEETDDLLIRSLFFNNTKDQVKKSCQTDILANHYANYFRVFSDISDVKKYVICMLSNEEFKKSPLPNAANTNHAQTESVAQKIKNEFPIYYFNCIYQIDSILHEWKSFDAFLYYIAAKVVSINAETDFDKYMDNFTPEDLSDEFSTGSAEKKSDDDFIAKIDEMMGGCHIDVQSKAK